MPRALTVRIVMPVFVAIAFAQVAGCATTLTPNQRQELVARIRRAGLMRKRPA